MADAKLNEAKTAVVETPVGRRVTAGKVKTFVSLGNPIYRLYFAQALCQTAAMNMQNMSRSLLVFRITGSAATIGIVAVAGSIPHIFASLFGGVIADRMQKKHILLLTMLAFSLVSLSVAVFLTTGLLNKSTWWILAINSVFQSSLMGLMIPARHSIIREIVNKDQLMNAISLNAMGGNVFQLMAPAATGFLIDAVGFNAVFYIMSACYALGAVFIFFMPSTSKIIPTTKNAIQNVTEGFKYIFRERDVLFILVFTLFGIIFAMPYQQLLPVFADKILIVGGKGVGAKGMGLLMSISGIGAFVSSLVLASLPNKKRGVLMLAGTLLLSLALITFSFSKSWPLSLGIMAIIGVGLTARQTLSNTLAQHYTTDEYRGRVMGVYDMQMSFTGLSVYVVGVLTDAFGVQLSVGVFAMLLAGVCLSGLLFVPRLRKLD